MTTSDARRWFERLLIAAAIVLLGRWASVAIAARQYQVQAARQLEAVQLSRLDEVVAGHGPASSRARAEARRSGLVGRLQIPRARIDVAVAEGTDSRTLERAVGHLRGTALPGEGGPVALAGHRDTYFRRLSALRPGDRIRLRTPDGTFVYRVTRSRIVAPDRTDVIAGSGLTLITCYPFHAIGPAPRRFVVSADPVSGTASTASKQRASG